MKHLNARLLLKQDTWKEMLTDNQRMVHVIPHRDRARPRLARLTPGLAKYEKALHQLSIFLIRRSRCTDRTHRRGLVGLVVCRERYSAAVLQRYTGVICRAARAPPTIS